MRSQDVTLAILWAAFSKIGSKELNRNLLAEGQKHQMAAAIQAIVDGDTLQLRVTTPVIVGKDRQANVSSAPDQAHVLSYVLSKLNEKTWSKVLAELPEEFKAAGCCLPPVDESLLEAVGVMLGRLRAKQTRTVRGSILCPCKIDIEATGFTWPKSV